MRHFIKIFGLWAAFVAAGSDGDTLLQQFSAPGRLLGNSFGNPGANATFDYVVVGAGLAGALTASRLAEALPHKTVAVLEAGSFYEISNGNYSQMWVEIEVNVYQYLRFDCCQTILFHYVCWAKCRRLPAVNRLGLLYGTHPGRQWTTVFLCAG